MNSILDYVQSGDLQVQPRVQPENIIDDSIQNSGREFITCYKPEDRLQSFNTGFGGNNVLHFEHQCKDRKLKTPLYKENYLSEFTNEIERALVRKNLGIYDNDEIINIIKDLIGKDTGGFITKLELNNTLSDFVKSELKSYANYEIPDKLFQL